MDRELIKAKMRKKVPIYCAEENEFRCPVCGWRLVEDNGKLNCPNPECGANFTAKLIKPELRIADPYIILELC